MVIGGIAVIARGVRRFTGDIDAVIRGDKIGVATLIEALAKKRIVPRIADAEQFARDSLVLLVRHEPSGVEFDISFVWTEFEQEAIAAATIARFGSVKAPMAQPDDLVVFKAIAGRGKDIDDVTALLALYPELDLVKIRARVRQLAALAELPELGAGLEGAIAAVAKARPVQRNATTTTARRPATKARRATKQATTKRRKRAAKSRATTKPRPSRSKK